MLSFLEKKLLFLRGEKKYLKFMKKKLFIKTPAGLKSFKIKK
jgi:hypothetical protein